MDVGVAFDVGWLIAWRVIWLGGCVVYVRLFNSCSVSCRMRDLTFLRNCFLLGADREVCRPSGDRTVVCFWSPRSRLWGFTRLSAGIGFSHWCMFVLFLSLGDMSMASRLLF